MDMNKTKEWLNRARVLSRKIEREKDKLQALNVLATSSTAGYSDMPRSDSPNLQKMETIACQVVDLRRQIQKDEQDLINVREEIRSALAMLDMHREILAMNDWYVECMPAKDIATDLCISERQVWILLKKSLAALSELSEM